MGVMRWFRRRPSDDEMLEELESLVAEDDDNIVGHIMFSPVRLTGADEIRTMALAPMAVTPARQRAGIGSALVRGGLAECRRQGVEAVFVVGHPSCTTRDSVSPWRRASASRANSRSLTKRSWPWSWWPVPYEEKPGRFSFTRRFTPRKRRSVRDCCCSAVRSSLLS